MASKRTLECVSCGHSWQSTAKPENVAAGKIKCKKCRSTSLTDNPSANDLGADKAKPEEAPATCKRCGGDKKWHSTKTGRRAKTSSEPLVDPSRSCPACK